jgi:hypothetical protein
MKLVPVIQPVVGGEHSQLRHRHDVARLTTGTFRLR